MAKKPKEEPKEQEPSVPVCILSATKKDKLKLWRQLVEVGIWEFDEDICDEAILFTSAFVPYFGDFETLDDLANLMESFMLMKKAEREWLSPKADEPVPQVQEATTANRPKLTDALSEDERLFLADKLGDALGWAYWSSFRRIGRSVWSSVADARESGPLSPVQEGLVAAEAAREASANHKEKLNELLIKDLGLQLSETAPVYTGIPKVLEWLRSGHGLIEEPEIRSPKMLEAAATRPLHETRENLNTKMANLKIKAAPFHKR